LAPPRLARLPPPPVPPPAARLRPSPPRPGRGGFPPPPPPADAPRGTPAAGCADVHIPARRHRVVRGGHDTGSQLPPDLLHQGPQLCLNIGVFLQQVRQPRLPLRCLRCADPV